MSAPVDSLNIKVNASARGANQQLDKLVQKMMQLRSTVNGINVGNLNTMSVSIQNFSKAAAGLNQVKTSDFTRMAKSIEKLANIRKGELNRAATAITNISKAFSNMGNISNGAMQMGQLAQSISRLGYKSTTQAIQNIPLLTTALKDMMTQLSQAPTVSQNLINMTNAMANLGRYASGVRTVGNAMKDTETSGSRFFGLVRNSANNIKNFVTNINSATSANRSFASTLGLLYAKFWALQRVFRLFGNAVTSSTDYIEEYNYFNVVTDKIGKEWSSQWKKYGYESAEAYSDSFSARMREDIGKLTGYSISEDGNANYDISKNLGLDLTKMTNYSAGIMNVTNSLGMTGEASLVTSKAMSKLAGDMSSFKNVDLSTVMNNFQSGLIGQSRAMYKYGIDITNTTLQQYAYNNGIKKSVMEMTQAEKMQLRMLAILDQSKSSWGDLARTVKSPSNQFRLFKTNVAAAGRTLGNIFLPIVAKVLPYINGLTIAVNKLLGYIFKITGLEKQYKELMGDSGTGYTDAFDGLEEDADNAKDAVDDTTDSVKKLAKQLMGFDELNVITTNKDSSKDKDSDGSGGAIDLTDELSKALADYEKVWNAAYDDMTNDAEKFADKLAKIFKAAWTSGDGSDIGSAIANWLNKGINWVNNNQNNFSDGLNRMASMLGTSLNGFVSSFSWAGLGKAIGGSIKSALEAEEKFFDTVNWINLGSSLASSLNSAIDSGAIQQFFTTMASKLKGAIETAFGLVTTFDFEGLGSAVGQGINDFFKKMDKVNEETGLNGWQELGKTISETIGGIATSISTALKTVDWIEVGNSIGESIASIDFGKVIWNLADMANELFNAICDAVAGITEKAPLETAIVALFAGLHLTGVTTVIGTAITTLLATKGLTLGSVVIGLGLGLATFKLADSESVVANTVLAPITAFLATYTFSHNIGLGLKVAAVTVAATAGFNIGKVVGEWLSKLMETEDMSEYRYNFTFSDLFTYDTEEWAQGIADWIVDIQETFGNKKEEICSAIADCLVDVFSGDFHFTIPFTDFKLPSANELKKGIKELIGKTGKNVFNVGIKLVKNGWSKLKDWIGTNKVLQNGIKLVKNGWTNLKSWVGTNKVLQAGIKLVKSGWTSLKNWLGDMTAKLGIKIPKIKISYDADGSANKFWKLLGFDGTPKWDISYAANGGLFGPGQLVMTREKGPELVGTYGNKTAVMNNNQIVQSVSDGVFNALAPVLTQVVNAVNGLQTESNGQALYVEGVSDGDIVRITTKANSDHKKRYGKPLYV